MKKDQKYHSGIQGRAGYFHTILLYNVYTEAKLSAAIRPFLKYYDFAATEERLLTLTGMYAEDISGFHLGDVEDGYTFIGHLVARDEEVTTPDVLLVFEKDGKYTVGCTVGGMVIPISLEDALG